MTTDTPQLNDHNKAEYPPMHNSEFKVSQTFQYSKTRLNRQK